MSNTKINYVIYSPLYNENTGGYIVLHKLCAILSDLGYNASLWHAQRPCLLELKSYKGLKKLLIWVLRFRVPAILGLKDLHSPYRLNLTSYKDLRNAVIVYPETINGNPLGAVHIVRWFLNKPGRINGLINYGPNELYFFHGEHFNDSTINPDSNNKLCVVDLMKTTYFNRDLIDRSGMCYMIRKGKGRELTAHEPGAICIDGMSHSQVAEVFALCKYFVSYDLYTMYSHYAVMCGCISVVVPQDGLSKEDWLPNIEDRYGIAYGWDDISWAVQTRSDLFSFQSQLEAASIASVEEFVNKTELRFHNAPLINID